MKKNLLAIILTCFFYNSLSLAEENNVNISWKISHVTERASGKKLIQIKGVSNEDGSLDFGGDSIVFTPTDGQTQKLKPAKVIWERLPIKVKKNEEFTFNLVIKNGKILLPAKFAALSGAKESYLLNLEINNSLSGEPVVTFSGKQEVDSNVKPKISTKEYRSEVSIDIGANVMGYKVDSDITSKALNFNSFKLPSVFIEGKFLFSQNFVVSSFYKISPGNVSSTSSLVFDEDSYNWTVLGVDVKYMHDSLRFKTFGAQSLVGFMAGTQMHQVPFVTRVGGSSSAVTLEYNSINTLSAGISLDTPWNKFWSSEIFMRYQHPIQTGSLFSVSSATIFDGSIGLRKLLDKKKKWFLGAYWYGQYQSYSFKHRDPALNEKINGKQTLIFSNLAVRLTRQF